MSLSDRLFETIKHEMRDEDGLVIVTGEEVVIALVDVLASLIASSPAAQTVRGRRLVIEDVTGSLKAQIEAYQALRVRPVSSPVLLVS